MSTTDDDVLQEHQKDCFPFKIRCASDETIKEAMKTDEPVVLFSFYVHPYHYGLPNQGPGFYMFFHQNAKEPSPNDPSKMQNIRCASWWVVWKISDEAWCLPYRRTDIDTKLGIQLRVYIQLNDEYVLGFLWFKDTKRHSTIMKNYGCKFAASMTGTWEHALPPTKAKKRANQPLYGDVPLQRCMDRQGKAMVNQLMFEEFRRSIMDRSNGRFMQDWEYKKVFGDDGIKRNDKNLNMWYPSKTPVRPHPRERYPVRFVLIEFGRMCHFPEVSYLRPNPKKQRLS
jgi:hypothetical protein